MKRLCSDLKVLGRGDLRTLLKWRLKMRARWREAAEARAAAAGADGAPAPEPARDEDEAALEELGALAAEASARERLAVRKAKLRLSKQKERLALKMELPGDRLDVQEDAELFSLSKIKGEQHLQAILGPDDGAGVSADLVLDDDDDLSLIHI
mgnify:CR=1 FL=1